VLLGPAIRKTGDSYLSALASTATFARMLKNEQEEPDHGRHRHFVHVCR
jgi:hypothetical protein